MGYYSDVYLTVDDMTYNMMSEELKNNPVWQGRVELDIDPDHHDQEHWIVWRWVKWYESFDDIKAIASVLSDANDKGWDWHMMRQGEELDDIERTFSDGGWEMYHIPMVCLDFE